MQELRECGEMVSPTVYDDGAVFDGTTWQPLTALGPPPTVAVDGRVRDGEDVGQPPLPAAGSVLLLNGQVVVFGWEHRGGCGGFGRLIAQTRPVDGSTVAWTSTTWPLEPVEEEQEILLEDAAGQVSYGPPCIGTDVRSFVAGGVAVAAVSAAGPVCAEAGQPGRCTIVVGYAAAGGAGFRGFGRRCAGARVDRTSPLGRARDGVPRAARPAHLG